MKGSILLGSHPKSGGIGCIRTGAFRKRGGIRFLQGLAIRQIF